MNLVMNAQLHRTQQYASLILISRSASAPRGPVVWRGRARRRDRRRPRPPRGRGRPRASRWGRRVREGGGATARPRDTAPRIGASFCSAAAATASSGQAASARRLQGVRSTFSRSFPHAAPPASQPGSLARSGAHTHTA